MNCYKKRVRDNELILIGKFIQHEDRDMLDIDIYWPLTKESLNIYDTYYSDFYNENKKVVEVDISYYDSQAYINGSVIGFIGLDSVCYYDSFGEDSMVKLLAEIS